MVLGKILLTFITVLVGVNLVPSVANSVYEAGVNATGGPAGVTNTTGAALALLNLIPLFFVLGILLATVSSTIEVLNKLNF